MTIGFSSAQIHITGKVRDSLNNAPLSNASVVFYPAGESNILGYDITDDEGQFKVAVQTSSDSLQYKISSLGYNKAAGTVLAKTQNRTFKISKKAESLEEVFLRKPPIQKRGDTLVFDPDAFKSNKDRSIQDVLSKMPGVEIKASGEIYYRGKPINKFYVEGLDLMGSQYGMVSNNLSPDEVDAVEILENHQPLKVLDSVEPSERAAINLKMKNEITVSGNLEAGGGFTPGLWYGKLTPMIFTKKIQSLVSYQTNNTGEDVNDDFTRYSTSSFRYGYRNDHKKNWLYAAGPSSPPFSSKRWLDNESQAVSANALVKGENDYEYKINASYINNFTKREGGERTNYLLPGGDTLIDRNTLRRRRDESLDVSASIEHNVDSNYLKDILSFSKKWDRASSVLSQNQEPNRQYLNTPFTDIKNTFEVIFSLGDELLTLHSDIGYNESPQDLSVHPGVFSDVLSPEESFNTVKQQLTHKHFFANHSVSFTEKMGHFSLSFRPGIDYSNQSFDSKLLLDEEFKNAPDFKNNMRWEKLSTYANVNASYESDELRLNLKLPFNFSQYKIKDKIQNTEKSTDPFSLNPSFRGSYEFTDYWEINTNASLDKDYGPLNTIYSGFLLTNYRRLGRRDAPINETKSKRASVSFKYRNPITTWFGRAGYSYYESESNQINNLKTLADGSSVLETREITNLRSSNSVYANVSRLIPSLKTTFKLGTKYSHSNSDFLFNEDLIKNTSVNWQNNLKLTGDFTDWLTVEYTGSLGLSQTENTIQDKRKIRSQNHALSIYVYLFDDHSFNFSGEWLKNTQGNSSKESFFGDFMYRFTLSKERKIDFEIAVNNVFNTDLYRDVSVGDYTLSESYYILRPRQILVKVRFPL